MRSATDATAAWTGPTRSSQSSLSVRQRQLPGHAISAAATCLSTVPHSRDSARSTTSATTWLDEARRHPRHGPVLCAQEGSTLDAHGRYTVATSPSHRGPGHDGTPLAPHHDRHAHDPCEWTARMMRLRTDARQPADPQTRDVPWMSRMARARAYSTDCAVCAHSQTHAASAL